MLVTAIAPWACGTALAQDRPVPPCAGTPEPSARDAGASLNQWVWIDGELQDDWSPPPCTGWTAGPTKALLAGAGRFQLDSDTRELAARVARISSLKYMDYWSHSRGKWRKLFEEATALSSPDRDTERADFSEDELVPGAGLYYWVREDNPTAGVVYELVVHERTPNRFVFETINRTPLKAQLLIFRREIAAPGEFRQLYFIDRERDDTWRYYTLIRMGRAGSLAGTSAANYRNRAEAYFRYLAGLDMTREPPAAR